MPRRYLRPRVLVGHGLVLVAALVCLRLGWWQWDVFRHAPRGTVQNFGYALLWPVIAASFPFMWLRYLHLAQVEQAPRTDADADTDAPVDRRGGVVRDGIGDDAALDEVAHGPIDSPTAAATDAGRQRRHTRSKRRAAEVRTVGVGTINVGDDDPELAAYNRALARLAEQDGTRDR